jgi:SnoaL-like domain
METLREEPTKEPAARKPATVTRVPEAARPSSRSTPWLVAGLMITTAAFAVLAILTFVPRLRPSEPVRLTDAAVSAWDSGAPSAFSAVYSRDAVVVHADGTKVTGLGAIVGDARSLGRDFTIVRTGDVSVTPNGTYATATYRYTGAGHGTGVLVLQFDGGKVVRQWEYGLPPVSAPVRTATP